MQALTQRWCCDAAIQYFEALIGEQLPPTQACVDSLNRLRLSGAGSLDPPMHAATLWVKKPGDGSVIQRL